MNWPDAAPPASGWGRKPSLTRPTITLKLLLPRTVAHETPTTLTLQVITVLRIARRQHRILHGKYRRNNERLKPSIIRIICDT